MDNFISTLVFILPGILMYFWIQAFGINPVVKHSPTEMGAVAALLWLPVSITTIIIYNLIGNLYDSQSIWTIDELKDKAGNLSFLAWFIFLSLPISFILSVIYVKLIYPVQRRSINAIRKIAGFAELSDTSTVWEKFFIQVDTKRNNGALPLRIYKIDKPEETCLIGVMSHASRPFETERAIVLERQEELAASYRSHRFAERRTYVDLKSGIAIAELDLSQPKNTEGD
jgi:hypothetical protein